MKNFKLILNLVIVASSFMFFQCTSEYTPIAGADGKDGVDGVDGIDGSDANAALCISCHSSTHRDPIYASYDLSVHAMETLHATNGLNLVTSQYANRTGCVQCHTSSGFIDKVNDYPLATGAGTATGDPAYLGSQTITCTTCHDAHRSFDFENDGNDYALRVIDPVTLIDGLTQIDMGHSNTCVSCHQPRDVAPTPDGDGNFTITSSRYGPHHGPQSMVLEGIYGALIDGGSTAIPGARTAGHRTGASCVTCHMGETTDGTDGLHSWHPTENTCITCHTNGAPEEVTGYAADFQTLHDLLVAKGAITESGSTVSGTYPIKVAQAVWNYKTLEEDRSNGVHNPKFATALLKNSIEALQN